MSGTPFSSSTYYGATRVRKALIHFLMGTGLGALLGICWLLLIVRQLSIVDYGAYVAFSAFLNIFIVVNSIGLIAIAERYVPELRVKRSGHALGRFLIKIVGLRALALIISGALVAVFADPMAALLIMPDAGGTFQLFQLIVIGEGLARYYETIFDSLLKQKYSQISTLFRYGLRLLVLTYLSLSLEGPLTLSMWITMECICVGVSILVSTQLFWRVVQGIHNENPSLESGDLAVRRLIRYAVPTYTGRVGALLASIEMAKILTARLLGLEVAALFGFCASLAATLQRYLPTFLIIGMVQPLFIAANNSENRADRLNFLFSIVIKLNLLVFLPIFTFVILAGGPLVQMMSGAKFDNGGWIMVATLVFVLSQALRNAHGLVLVAIEDGAGALLAVLTAATAFYLSLLAVDQLGPYALLAGLAIGDICAMLVARFRVRSQSIDLNFPYVGFGKMALVAAVAAAIALLIDNVLVRGPDWRHLMALGSVSCLTYMLLLWPINTFTTEERAAINRALPKPVFVW